MPVCLFFSGLGRGSRWRHVSQPTRSCWGNRQGLIRATISQQSLFLHSHYTPLRGWLLGPSHPGRSQMFAGERRFSLQEMAILLNDVGLKLVFGCVRIGIRPVQRQKTGIGHRAIVRLRARDPHGHMRPCSICVTIVLHAFLPNGEGSAGVQDQGDASTSVVLEEPLPKQPFAALSNAQPSLSWTIRHHFRSKRAIEPFAIRVPNEGGIGLALVSFRSLSGGWMRCRSACNRSQYLCTPFPACS